MFRIFPFKFGMVTDVNKLGGIIGSFLDNIDDITEEHEDEIDKLEESNEFINLQEYDDMYVLTIELTGIDLREMSIQYNPGKISINLNRSEVIKSGFGLFTSNVIIKKNYKKEFKNIEAVEETKIFKILERGVFKISMPKKYFIDEELKIVDVDNYIEN
ncbi:Hsp20/alpha crystallin family protein [Clostridium uliginosum]|uniref:HSP20 family protein n=1 Tax=Clostridium uliginosum TaxID=119641 RepID=A0A1I1PFL9_9CLOT|nr:Hsp20/alpha crystallin family protein [Clostridium uliginosum]SFD06428.1 HSP20 family protein [Clostridium uliginosum]